jgi:hypothetical protein
MKAFYHEGVVEADGEKLTLVCDFSAIDRIESITGENWADVVAQLDDPSRSLLVKVLWGLLCRKHDGVTLDEATSVTFSKDFKGVGLVMGDVIRRACNIPGPTDELPDEPAKKKSDGRRKGPAENG